VFGHRQYLGLIEVAEMVYLIYFLGCGSYFVWFVVPFVPVIILFQVCCSLFFFFFGLWSHFGFVAYGCRQDRFFKHYLLWLMGLHVFAIMG
jgi:hypothetical protein